MSQNRFALFLLWGGIASTLEVIGATLVAVVSSPMVVTAALVAATGVLAYSGYKYYTASHSKPVYSNGSSKKKSVNLPSFKN